MTVALKDRPSKKHLLIIWMETGGIVRTFRGDTMGNYDNFAEMLQDVNGEVYSDGYFLYDPVINEMEQCNFAQKYLEGEYGVITFNPDDTVEQVVLDTHQDGEFKSVDDWPLNLQRYSIIREYQAAVNIFLKGFKYVDVTLVDKLINLGNNEEEINKYLMLWGTRANFETADINEVLEETTIIRILLTIGNMSPKLNEGENHILTYFENQVVNTPPEESIYPSFAEIPKVPPKTLCYYPKAIINE